MRGLAAGAGGSAFPRLRAVEGMHADPVDLAHLAEPVRGHSIGVVVRRLADLVEPQPAVEHVVGDLLRLLPHVGFVDDELFTLAGEGELAGEVAVGVLVDHDANIATIKTPAAAVADATPHNR